MLWLQSVPFVQQGRHDPGETFFRHPDRIGPRPSAGTGDPCRGRHGTMARGGADPVSVRTDAGAGAGFHAVEVPHDDARGPRLGRLGRGQGGPDHADRPRPAALAARRAAAALERAARRHEPRRPASAAAALRGGLPGALRRRPARTARDHRTGHARLPCGGGTPARGLPHAARDGNRLHAPLRAPQGAAGPDLYRAALALPRCVADAGDRRAASAGRPAPAASGRRPRR